LRHVADDRTQCCEGRGRNLHLAPVRRNEPRHRSTLTRDPRQLFAQLNELVLLGRIGTEDVLGRGSGRHVSGLSQILVSKRNKCNHAKAARRRHLKAQFLPVVYRTTAAGLGGGPLRLPRPGTCTGESIERKYLRRIFAMCVRKSVHFVAEPLARVGCLVYSLLRHKTMKTMLKTIYTPTFAEAAQAVSAPCWHLPVNDGRRLESALTLAERCAR
jgi:hypothetical protein